MANLKTNILGRTGLAVTQLGYGSMGLRGPRTWGVRVVEEAEAERVLHAVLDAGINFIDTAPDYGISEERIGRSLGSRRGEFFLATKCGCAYIQHDDHLEVRHEWKPEVVRRNIDASLRRMRTDYVDLLQFHGGDAETLRTSGLIDLLLDLRERGLTRFIGVSTKLPDLPALIDLNVFDTFQIPFSCLAPEHDEWLSRAAASGAGIIVRGGVAQGGPDAEIQRTQLNEVWERAGLEELLPGGMTRAALILRHTLSHPACHTTIVGTCNLLHLAENLASCEAGALPAELCDEIRRRVAAVSG
ncbi:MAG: aldo/keto reductase [Planctomycetales bacterium]|nr:aldo/keto reductase [Planctomycetales bacterium]